MHIAARLVAVLLFVQHADQFSGLKYQYDRRCLKNKAGIAGKPARAEFGHDLRQLQHADCQILKKRVAFWKKEHNYLLE